MTRIQLVRGDLTEQRVDAIVNAANSSLLGGGGVDGAIHRAGGPQILQECQALRSGPLPTGLPVGAAVATGAGRLPARHVIHVVGPVYDPRREAERRPLLASCYTEALRVADGLAAATVAFPAVSAGAYGWPLADAARTAVQAISAATSDVQEAVIVVNSERAYEAFRAALNDLERPLPPPPQLPPPGRGNAAG